MSENRENHKSFPHKSFAIYGYGLPLLLSVFMYYGIFLFTQYCNYSVQPYCMVITNLSSPSLLSFYKVAPILFIINNFATALL